MTQQQIISEFERFSRAEKSFIIRELLLIFEKDLNGEKSKKVAPFTIEPLQFHPRGEFDFDNIGKLIEQAEGDRQRF